MKQQITIFLSVIILLVLGTIAAVMINNRQVNVPSKYDVFAQCLKDKGEIFYGAFWCPHCKAQKELFGSSVKFLPYSECSLPDASGSNQLCKDKNIEGYPTWEFSKEFSVESESAPIICDKIPGITGEPDVCKQQGFASNYYKTFAFSGVKILSEKDPVH